MDIALSNVDVEQQGISSIKLTCVVFPFCNSAAGWVDSGTFSRTPGV